MAHHIFTLEQRLAGIAKSVATRKAKAEARRLNKLNPQYKHKPEPGLLVMADAGDGQRDPVRLERLSNVREEIARLRRLSASSNKLLDVTRAAAALDRLIERECQLAGWPGPGQLRPAEPRRRAVQPWTMTPQPVVNCGSPVPPAEPLVPQEQNSALTDNSLQRD